MFKSKWLVSLGLGALVFLTGCESYDGNNSPEIIPQSTTTTTSDYGYYLKCSDGTTMFLDGPKSSPRTECPKYEPKPVEPWTYPTCRGVFGNEFQCWQDEHGNYRSFN